MAGMSNQISNVLGVAIPYDLKRQLMIRSKKLEADHRSDDDVTYLLNKSCWVRLVSSVNVVDLEYFRKYFPDLDLTKPDSLAKKFVLFGGTSEYIGNEKNFSYNLRSGFGPNGSYGMLGNIETQLYGYKPMPGITDVRIETQGKLGSIRSATINFKAWDKLQLDIIDALYFKMGFAMFLEWGHTMYFDNGDNGNDINTSKLKKSELLQIDPFEPGVKKETILRKVSKNIDDSNGNYDAMFGMCTQFDFSMNEDGGFDCSMRMIALGSLADNIKINQPKTLPGILDTEIKALIKIYEDIQREKQRQEELAKQAEQKQKEAEQAKLPVPLTVQETFAAQRIADLFDAAARGGGTNITKLNSALNAITSVELYREVNRVLDSLDLTYTSIESLLNGELETDNLIGLKSTPTEPQIDAGVAIVNLSKRIPQLKKITWTSKEINANGKKVFVPQKGTLKIIDDGTSTPNPRPGPTIIGATPEALDIVYKKGSFDTATDTIIAEAIYNSGTGTVGTDDSDFVKNIKKIQSPAQYIRVNEIAKTIGKKYSIPTQINKEFEDDNTKEVQKIIAHLNKIFGSTIATANFPQRVQGQGASLSAPTYEMYSFKLDEKEVLALINEKYLQENPDPNSARQKNINSIFCGLMDNKVSSGTYKGYTWEVYKSDFDVSSAEETIAKNSCTRPAEETADPAPTVDTIQKDESLKYQSGLEVFIRAIQLHSFNKAYTSLGVKEGNIGVIDLSQEKTGFTKNLLSTGVLSKVAIDYIDNVENYKSLKNSQENFDLLYKYASYGFNHNLMSRNLDSKDDITAGIPQVNFKDLYKAYVVPYQVSQGIAKDVDVNFPVYIKLGFLLFTLNHMCTLYDSPEGESISEKNQSPLIYIDFNPETNFCLSEPLQMSTDVLKMLIPFRGTNAEYETLFDPNLIQNGSIKKPESSADGESKPLFKPQSEDYLSSQLPKFKGISIDSGDAYRGKIMNILLSADYILSLCKNFANNDEMQSVKLKPFLQQIIDDINKYLGGINLLRIAYDDKSNCLYIVDDQIQPMGPNEKSVPDLRKNKLEISSELPLFGKGSIARSLSIKTDISSKLSNMIAISANSNIKSDASVDATPFGHFNAGYKDRYIPQKLTVNSDINEKTTQHKPNDAEIAAANVFNEFVKSALNTGQISDQNVSMATNYFIERMNKRKGEKEGTRSSAMIPISVSFTTDGISGFSMGHAFLLPQEILPRTYAQTIKTGNDESIIGFVVTGLTHTLSNNTWLTDVKANMIFLKDTNAFKISNKSYNIKELSSGTFVVVPTENTDHPNYNSQVNQSNYPSTPSAYKNVVFANIGLGNPASDKINPNTLKDVSDAAVKAGVTVSITTAVSGHHTNPPSRHTYGYAVDIALIDGIAVRPQAKNRSQIDEFVSQLISLGYVKNKESGNPKAVLTFDFPNHDDHVHVSNKT